MKLLREYVYNTIQTVTIFSGGHFNPALTVASWLAGGTRTVLAVFYIFVQFFGAFIGALLFRVS